MIELYIFDKPYFEFVYLKKETWKYENWNQKTVFEKSDVKWRADVPHKYNPSPLLLHFENAKNFHQKPSQHKALKIVKNFRIFLQRLEHFCLGMKFINHNR